MMRALLLALVLAVPAYAADSSDSVLWGQAPPMAGNGQANTFLTTAPSCVSWVPVMGITNAVSLSFYVTSPASAGRHCSVSIYDATGTTRLATTDSVLCDTTGVKQATGLTPYTLAAGIKYHICGCAEAGAGGTEALGFANDGLLRSLSNTLSVPMRFSGSNACQTDGGPPATIGSFSAGDRREIYPLLGTSTP